MSSFIVFLIKISGMFRLKVMNVILNRAKRNRLFWSVNTINVQSKLDRSYFDMNWLNVYAAPEITRNP